ncbi:MAG: type IV secretory system conjugative DNA transfer family protein, partial [Porcipelethomonas sp.]
VGKTAFFLYPNIEFACASGMSFLSTDTKGDVARNCGTIAKRYYGYNVSVIDLRNPTRSDENNMLHLVNKYMDIYLSDKSNLSAKAKAEKYAKITAKTIISIGGGDSAAYGQNAYFYDAAEGLLASLILLLSEFGDRNERHIVSVFKLIQDLLEPEKSKKSPQKNGFKSLMERLPDEHKAKWLAGSALFSADQAMMSIISTALSRLNEFIDSEIEQILCFGTAIDAEKFCKEKSAIFIVLPEEDQSKYFMVSLLIQQLYREILMIADENGGVLSNRVMFYADEFGTFPKIEGAEAMFSASRSRRISIVAIIQSFAQLDKNYGKEGQEIITDNTQLTIFGGFAPNSQSAEILSKALGEQTILSGSVSHGKEKSQSLQMIGRPLMTTDELKSMPKGQFIVMKTGMYPMISPLKLYFKWGISFEEPYILEDKGARKVTYMNKDALIREVEIKYPQNKPAEDDNFEDELPKRHKKPKTGGV